MSRIRTCLIAFMLPLIVILRGSNILANACHNVGAYCVSRSLVEQSDAQDWLHKSMIFSEYELQLQPDSVAARRLMLSAMAVENSSVTSLPPALSDWAVEGNDMLMLNLGKVLWDWGDTRQATDVWRSVEHLEYYFMELGNRAYAEGNEALALVNYQISLSIDEERSGRKLQMYTNLCDYENAQGDFEGAVFWCSQTVDVQRSVWTLLRLGALYLWNGDYDTALALFEEARDIDDAIPSTYYYLCVTYRYLGELTLARKSCKKGMNLAPTNPYLGLASGDLYAQVGELSKAYCFYQQVIESATEKRLIPQARTKLEELRNSIIATPNCDSQ